MSWGNLIIFLFIIALLAISYLVKYPDTITARAFITSKNPPISFASKSTGNIRLLIQNGVTVGKDEFLGYIESGTSIEDVRYLYSNIDLWQQQLLEGNAKFFFELDLRKNILVTQIQPSFGKFLVDLENFKLFHDATQDFAMIHSLKKRISYLEELNNHLEQQQVISKADLLLSKKKLGIDSTLFQQDVISMLNFDESKSKHNQIKYNLESSYTNYLSNKIQVQQLKEQLEQLTIQRTDNRQIYLTEMLNDLGLLKEDLLNFINQYVFVAPFGGTISFPVPITDNQYVVANEELFNLVPDSEQVYCVVSLPIAGSGKAAVGQRVNVKLDNFPHHEYGFLRGTIKSIEITPSSDGYTAVINLPKRLLTTYNRQLPFVREMTGSADIITKDLRLIERFFNQFRALNDN